MTLAHEIFDIFGFVVALLGLIHIYAKGEVNRRFIVVAAALLLLGLGSLVMYENVDHRRSVRKVQVQIVELLGTGPRTLEELADSLRFEELPLLREAVDGVVRDGEVKSQRYALSQPDGSVIHAVRLYYRAGNAN